MKYAEILPGTNALLVYDSSAGGVVIAFVEITSRKPNPRHQLADDPDKDHVYFEVTQELNGTVKSGRPGYPVSWFCPPTTAGLRSKVLELYNARLDTREQNLDHIDLSIRHYQHLIAQLEDERIRLHKVSSDDAAECGALLARLTPRDSDTL